MIDLPSLIREATRRATNVADVLRAAGDDPPLQKPRVLQFPINDICNSRCQMCDIWQRKRGHEITPAELRTALAHDLFSEVTDVGINGGEPTLRKDIGDVVAALCDTLPKLHAVHLITNAIREKQVMAAIDAITDAAGDAVQVHVMVSMDGVGDVHDRVRGRAGNFESAARLVAFAQGHPAVERVQIGCTMVRDNAEHLEALLLWAIEHDVLARFRVAIPHPRLSSDDERDAFALSADETDHVAHFLDTLRLTYEQDPYRNAFYLSLRNQLVYGADRATGCPWRSRGATLLPDGGLAYCAVASDTLGNVLTDDAAELYFGNEAHLRDIRATACAGCRHDYVAPESPRHFIVNKAAAMLDDHVGVSRLALRDVAVRTADLRAAARLARAKRTVERANARPATGGDGVLVIGWYGTETLGDKGILGGVIATLRDVDPDIAIDVAAIEPFVTMQTARQMPEMGIRDVIALRDAPSRVHRYRAVVVGGGPMMSSPIELVDLVEVAAAARAGGVPFGLLGVGLGPFGTASRDAGVDLLVETASALVTRDDDSAATARLRAPGAVAPVLGADPATIWIRRTEATAARSDRPYVLLGLRRPPHREYASHLDDGTTELLSERFAREMHRFADAFTSLRPDVDLVPFCMHKLPVGGDDRFYHHELWDDRPAIRDRIDWKHRTPSEDAATFAGASGVLGMRFHSAVFGLGHGVPTVGIDYTFGGKVEALFRENGLGDRVFPIAEVDGVTLAERLDIAMNDERSFPLETATTRAEEALRDAWRSLLTPTAR